MLLRSVLRLVVRRAYSDAKRRAHARVAEECFGLASASIYLKILFSFESSEQVKVAYIARGSKRVLLRRTDHRRAFCERSGQLLLRRLTRKGDSAIDVSSGVRPAKETFECGR